ncbi:Phenylacetic acid degradation-related domain containing protein [Parasponia andersonii]|uniref:Acyl-coenzyme A thioesterase 13 n=1 Tax=Parasponia andersonii TaxID=3476 RepID=A0A2P5BRT0_PARAD|nr:Phenylacetic acid degradation-related domain containing protein [Parasponia andersonii]
MPIKTFRFSICFDFINIELERVQIRSRCGTWEMEVAAKRYLEKGEEKASAIDALPSKLFEALVTQGLHVDLIETGRLVCSFTVPTRLLNDGNYLHNAATVTLVDLVGSAVIYSIEAPHEFSGVSLEINVSYMDAAYAGEEIEVEAKVLRLGKAIGVISVELRKKKTGKIIAQGRHTKYLAASSKL